MEGSLLELGSALSLTEEEDEGIILPRDLPRVSDPFALSLVGRLLSPHPVNFEALSHTFQNLLRPAKGVNVRRVADNRFCFVFNHVVDLRRTLALRSWTFDRNLLILQELSPGADPESVLLDWCPFFIRVHGIPYRYRSTAIARLTGAKLGVWEDEANVEDFISWSGALRLRILLDVNLPLKWALRLRLPDDHSLVVRLTYERLPNFCYLCGRLGHIQRLRDLQFADGFIDPSVHAPYGPWLRDNSFGG
ncbi:hypothetical protein Salat_1678400 [Sesamum alatum]|uniref:DUF4283 domain-containing protein n=1 Tax=Sesamum alatum TaxID=300844 RepID=A0AAE2CJV1_9LAMI|nr:hypothetical protein Salat_1678400 [Sesamum alatum]